MNPSLTERTTPLDERPRTVVDENGEMQLLVEASETRIDITAVAGEGNLLGDLLCAVVGLLNPK